MLFVPYGTRRTAMSHLKALTFTTHKPSIADPTMIRRQRLVERLEEQRQLAKDPTFAPMVRRWKKDENGVRQPVDTYRRIKPWWRQDATGSLVLVLKKGLKTLELEKGKAGIVVGSAERLEGVLNTLIAAARAGELDGAICPRSNTKPR
jgi:hypothetical protein